MKKIYFEVPGEPMGKQRPRFSSIHGYVQTYTPRETTDYEDKVAELFKKSAKGFQYGDDTPLHVDIEAYFGIKKSATKKDKELMLKGELLPTKKPDADNQIKILLDGMQKAGVFKDDKQVVSITFKSCYGELPHTEISISEERII